MVEVLPALAQDSLSQAEISLQSVTENLADRPIRPDKSGQEMHTKYQSHRFSSSFHRSSQSL